MKDVDVHIVIPGLPDPTSDGIYVPSIENFNTFGFIMLVIQIGLGLLGMLLSWLTEAFRSSFFISLIIGSYFCILVWVCTLPKGCKDRLSDISLLIFPFAAAIEFFLDPAVIYDFIFVLFAIAIGFYLLLLRAGFLEKSPTAGVRAGGIFLRAFTVGPLGKQGVRRYSANDSQDYQQYVPNGIDADGFLHSIGNRSRISYYACSC
jgi:hypothetical protein